jgi:hypothetical protein
MLSKERWSKDRAESGQSCLSVCLVDPIVVEELKERVDSFHYEWFHTSEEGAENVKTE